MKYEIRGFHKVSFIDYPGKVAAVLFVGGCNFACPYCHNETLVKGTAPVISWEDTIKPYLLDRLKLLDGVVISGGEPSLYPWVLRLMAEIKELGYAVKLDTNGSHPEFIKQAVAKGLVDYIAMDIKTSFERYEKVCGVPANAALIRESVDCIMKCGIDHQYRTTMVPTLVEPDNIKEIALQIKGAQCYVLQQFKPVETMLDKNLFDVKLYNREQMENLEEQIKPFVQNIQLVNF